MTTTPVPTCTDDLLAEIEAEFQNAYDKGLTAYIDPSEGVSLLARLHAAENDAGRYRWLTRQAWFQCEFDRYDIDDGGLQSIFERECAHIIDKSIQSEASK